MNTLLLLTFFLLLLSCSHKTQFYGHQRGEDKEYYKKVLREFASISAPEFEIIENEKIKDCKNHIKLLLK